MIVNFLKDTLNKMEENGVSPDDVLYVFNSFGYCSWEEFEKLANFDYNNGYGLVAIDLNLIVRGSDWWLERAEYDGSEWWEYKTLPMLMPNTKIVKMSRFFDADSAEGARIYMEEHYEEA